MSPDSQIPGEAIELAFEVTMEMPYEQALPRVIEGLKAEGFGVLTRVDIHEAFKEKLGVDFRPYTILGACNPPLALKALSARPEAGLMLPCNVIVESLPGTEGKQQSMVRIIDPIAMMKAAGLANDPVLSSVGSEAEAKLRRVAESLQS